MTGYRKSDGLWKSSSILRPCDWCIQFFIDLYTVGMGVDTSFGHLPAGAPIWYDIGQAPQWYWP